MSKKRTMPGHRNPPPPPPKRDIHFEHISNPNNWHGPIAPKVDEDGMTTFNSLEKLENMKAENGKWRSVKHFDSNQLVDVPRHLKAEKNNEYKYVMPFGTRVAVVMLAAMAGGFVVMIIASLISLCK